MHRNAKRLFEEDGYGDGVLEWEQGFIDQKGIWMSREEAWRPSQASGGGDSHRADGGES